MEPLNYQFADPSAAILNGVKLGAFQADAEQKRIAQQQALLAAQQQQNDLRAVAMNPNATASDYAGLMTKYPALAESLGKASKTMEEGQRQNLLNSVSRVYSALSSGNPQLAAQLLRERAKAETNPQEAAELNRQADMAEKAPDVLRSGMGFTLAAALGPEKFAENYSKIGGEQRAQEQAPAELRQKVAGASKAESEATIKAEEAKVAPQAVMLDLQKKGWDITKIQQDIAIAKEDNRIKAMNAAANREGNDLKRQELKLKIEEAQTKRDDKVREKVATAEAGAANIDNMLNTVERIKKNPRLNDVVGAIEGRMPALTSDESADAVALIETLGSQAFLAQIPNIKGMGALSNAEGEKLQAAFQNLTRTQSEAQFRANLDEAARLLKKGRDALSKSTGVPLGKPDTPAAPGARPPLASFQGK